VDSPITNEFIQVINLHIWVKEKTNQILINLKGEKFGMKLQGKFFFTFRKEQKPIEFINNRLKDYNVLDQKYSGQKIYHNLIALSVCGLYNMWI
jgi:hypothetical protein